MKEKYFYLYCYLIFAIFILTYKSSIFYLAIIPINLIMLFFARNKETKRDVLGMILISIIVVVFIISFIYNSDLKGRCLLFLFELIFLHYISCTINTHLDKIVKFINVTYLVYLFLSIINFRCMLNKGVTIFGVDTLNIFRESVLGYSITTFCGLAGSTSDIDSYSGLILLINYIFKVSKHRKVMLCTSLMVTLLTFRFTPLVSLVGVIFLFSIKSDKFCSIVKNLIFLVSYNSFLLVYIICDIVKSEKLQRLLFKITHARSDIWIRFINMLKYEQKDSVLWGYKENIPMINIDGSVLVHNNPHSSFLNILLIYGVIVFVLMEIYILFILKNIKLRPYMMIVSYMFICSITNEGIFYLRNPIWLITMYLCAFHRVHEKGVNKENKILKVA